MEEITTGQGGDLRRRDFMRHAGQAGLATAIVSALPVAARMVVPEAVAAQSAEASDGTLQAFFDTMIPGRRAGVTELGNPIHPRAIAGVDREPGAVEADALALAHHPLIGFDTLIPPFLADLEARSLPEGGPFLDLDYEARERVCVAGLDFGNESRQIWEAAAAIPFTAFCAAANIPNATRGTSVGYRVMGHPGTAPNGYRNFSYRRRLNHGITKKGSLP